MNMNLISWGKVYVLYGLQAEAIRNFSSQKLYDCDIVVVVTLKFIHQFLIGMFKYPQ